MTESEKIVFKNLMERTLVHIAWEGSASPENLRAEYHVHKNSNQLFKFADVHNSFYNNKSKAFTTHELDIMKYAMEKISALLMKYAQDISKRYTDLASITPIMYEQFAKRFWSNPENEKHLSITAPNLWFP